VVILAFTALVVDIGLLRNDRQSLVNAVDAGALAGGTLMPVDGSKIGAVDEVTALIDRTVQATYPGVNYGISYRCLIGTDAGADGAFDSEDIKAYIPLDCDPSGALKLQEDEDPSVDDFKPAGLGQTWISDCSPDKGDKCNVVVVKGNVTTEYNIAPVVGVDSGNTGVVQSAACRGLCGELPDTPFDVVLVLDTSGSMERNCAGGERDPREVFFPATCEDQSGSKSRIDWAKDAANQLMDSLAKAKGTQKVGAVRYSGEWNANSPPPASTLSPLTTDFAAVRAAIAPLSGAGNTPLKQGMAQGMAVMTAGARSGVEQVFILLSDGRPWPDQLGNARPTAADVAAFRGAADQVFSVLIGPDFSCTNSSNCLDIPLMLSLAKAKNGDDGTKDPSHFIRVVDASKLPKVFEQIVLELLNPRSRLIQLYPAPIVTAVGSGTTVSISGKYFTGATQVTFGGTNAVTFTFNSDTSITATPPGGTPGQTVHVRVTSSGGSSPVVPADQYTYPP